MPIKRMNLDDLELIWYPGMGRKTAGKITGWDFDEDGCPTVTYFSNSDCDCFFEGDIEFTGELSEESFLGLKRIFEHAEQLLRMDLEKIHDPTKKYN